MTTTTAAPTVPPRIRAWLSLVTVVWTGLAVWFLTRLEPGLPSPVRWSVFIASILVEAALFGAASRRPELGTRLQQALGISAMAFVLTALTYLYVVIAAFGGVPPMAEWVDQLLTFLTYAVAVVGFLWMPMVPLQRSGWWRFWLDAAVAVGGLLLCFWMLVADPHGPVNTEIDQRKWVLSYGAALLLDLVALNVLIVRGVARPSRRAFWCFIAALALEAVSLLVNQYYEQMSNDLRIEDAVYLGVQMLYVCAGVFFLTDPAQEPAPDPGPAWMRSLNPLPFLSIAGVSALLMRESAMAALPAFGLLALGLVILVGLLAVRLLLTVWDNARLLRAERDAERERQVEKMDAIGRLAGGVAHEFNNLMTTVLGHAELGLQSPAVQGQLREDLHTIVEAATRAAGLTNELLSFSGRQFTGLVPLRVTDFVRARVPDLAATVPPGMILDVRSVDEAGSVAADPHQLAHALDQLVANAVEAMPDGGRVTISLSSVALEARLPTPFLTVPPGRYAALAVSDTGVGIAPELVGLIFDPFYSTKPRHAAAGLGLAAVYGIVAAHRGGIAVESEPGSGTTVRLYFPAIVS